MNLSYEEFGGGITLLSTVFFTIGFLIGKRVRHAVIAPPLPPSLTRKIPTERDYYASMSSPSPKVFDYESSPRTLGTSLGL